MIWNFYQKNLKDTMGDKMKNHLLFVHGISASKEDRSQMTARVIEYARKYDVQSLFMNGNIPLIKAMCWRSLGNFMKDLEDLKIHGQRWNEAVEDISEQLSEYMIQKYDEGDKIVLVGHSMGQPILVSALELLQKSGVTWVNESNIVTIGGPMGNPMVRIYFMQMNQRLWADTLRVKNWYDIWNPEDPICGGSFYERFLAAKDIKINFPGHPTPFSPMKEHSSYFDSKDFYDTIRHLVA
jgi:hypothetical protein